MSPRVKEEDGGPGEEGSQDQSLQGKANSRRHNKQTQPVKRRCVSTACIACRRRKSKCDGNTPSCAACSSVYHTPCVYDPNSDHRRKGVYKKDIDNLKTRNTTLQTLVQAILTYEEDEVFDLVRQMRTTENLEEVAESITARARKMDGIEEADSPDDGESAISDIPQFESELAGKMSELRVDGTGKFIGGTSNLIFLPPGSELVEPDSAGDEMGMDQQHGEDPITCWTTVTKNEELIRHLLTMYFTWHYAYFTTLSKELFYRDFVRGRPSQYCSALLVNTMLALGSHFSSWPAARADPEDSATAGNHFFKAAKRLLMENDEHERARLCTVQALALMSVREAGCGREGKGWVYSGMSFRMAYDLGLNVDASELYSSIQSEEEVDARKITFWGCFLFDKCWSNYLGRQPQLPASNISVPKPDVFPVEDAETWSAYTDSGVVHEHTQPSRTRAISLQITLLCEISGEVLSFFYHPHRPERPVGKQAELKQLTALHTRLEAWRKNLPKEMEPKDGQLPQVLLMHMFFHLLYIHLYRPFLKYTKSTSPLPSHVSPRKLCVQAATSISKLLRIYKRSYGLQQICNIAVYIAHSACTIHLLNLPDKNAQRDIIHGLKHLEEIAESWLCARRTLRILELSATKWNIDLPHQAFLVLERSHAKYGSWGSWDQVQSPTSSDEYALLAVPPVSPGPPIDLTTPGPTPGPNQYLDSQSIASMDTPNPNIAPPPLPHASTFPTTRSSPPACICDRSTQANACSAAPGQPVPCLLYTNQPLPPQQHQQPQQDIMANMAQQQLAGDPNHINTTGTAQSGFPMPPSYGGMRNLVRESEDWWLKDQGALALGMNNWVDDWSGNPDMGFESDPSTSNALDVGAGGCERSLLDTASTNAANSAAVTGPGTPVVPMKMEDGTTPGTGYPIGFDQNNMNQYYFDGQNRPL